jgi:hypothetical protein
MNRRHTLSFLCTLSLALPACSRASSTASPTPSASASASATASVRHSDADLKTLTVDEVDALLAEHNGKTFIYDNNPKERYEQGHLPSATWVNFRSLAARDLPADKSAALVFYCASES